MGEMGTARNAVGRVQCQQNLKKLYPLILQHVALRGEFPVDADGNLTVSKLAMGNDEDRQSASNLVACCGDSIDSCYLWGVNVSLGANGVLDESSRQVIAYDRPGNHLQRLGNGLLQRKDGVVQEEAQLLLADGCVITWRGDSPAYAAWTKRYASGSGEPYPPGIERRILGDSNDLQFAQD